MDQWYWNYILPVEPFDEDIMQLSFGMVNLAGI